MLQKPKFQNAPPNAIFGKGQNTILKQDFNEHVGLHMTCIFSSKFDNLLHHKAIEEQLNEATIGPGL